MIFVSLFGRFNATQLSRRQHGMFGIYTFPENTFATKFLVAARNWKKYT